MAEAEDLIVDAARHATNYAQALVKRHRARNSNGAARPPNLLDLAPRLDLLVSAVHGRVWPLRVAQPPAPTSLLRRLFKREGEPRQTTAVPCCDGHAIWLPNSLDGVATADIPVLFRAMALQQAQRALLRQQGNARVPREGVACSLELVLEAELADATLLARLPGLRNALACLRATALRRRPPLDRFPTARARLERWLRERLAAPLETPLCTEPGDSMAAYATRLSTTWAASESTALLKDWWTGDWPRDEAGSTELPGGMASEEDDHHTPARSARLTRRPTIRKPQPDEDDTRPGAWMIQTTQPHEHAEDPMGLQRPADRDTNAAAEEHAESVSELDEARLVRNSQPAREVLLSDDLSLPPSRSKLRRDLASGSGIRYPEWDFRRQAYRDPGTTVWTSEVPLGSAEWGRRTLEAQATLLSSVRRQFEMLRATPVILRKREDGDEPDLDACIDAYADRRAGVGEAQAFYRSTRIERRDCAVLVLVDVSGSTDSWVAGQRRIIDVEREALLVLSTALESSGTPHAILAFSGHGPQQVAVRSVKAFEEHRSDTVVRRIAGLEPERYTRTGAALRHASSIIAQQPTRHRLLMLLSDGKPNDCDDYEGRYGIEDMRQAIQEIRHAGQSPFCLTVDRHASAYLSHIFGLHQYALLPNAEHLPTVLLDWMRRLLVR